MSFAQLEKYAGNKVDSLAGVYKIGNLKRASLQ
jgi:hypothetical protein